MSNEATIYGVISTLEKYSADDAKRILFRMVQDMEARHEQALREGAKAIAAAPRSDEGARSTAESAVPVSGHSPKNNEEQSEDAALPDGRWIDVEERLPMDKQTVWLANPKHGIAFLGCLDDFGEGWCWAKCNGTTYIEKGVIVGECESDDYEVTHWMPLPTPPTN